MDLTASFNVSLKMAPNETCQSVSYLCVHTKCAWEMSASAVGSGEELLFVGENWE